MGSSEINIIMNKVATNQELTNEEEMHYLTEVIGMSERDAANLISIVENNDDSLIID